VATIVYLIQRFQKTKSFIGTLLGQESGSACVTEVTEVKGQKSFKKQKVKCELTKE